MVVAFLTEEAMFAGMADDKRGVDIAFVALFVNSGQIGQCLTKSTWRPDIF